MSEKYGALSWELADEFKDEKYKGAMTKIGAGTVGVAAGAVATALTGAQPAGTAVSYGVSAAVEKKSPELAHEIGAMASGFAIESVVHVASVVAAVAVMVTAPVWIPVWLISKLFED